MLAVPALLAAVGVLAACNPAGQSGVPTVPILPPTEMPALEAPGSSLGAVGGCVDPATFAILNQLQAQGADVPTLLADNKAALVTGLQAFQPPDEATTTWRDQLVADLQASDLTQAAADVQMLTSGEVTISSC